MPLYDYHPWDGGNNPNIDKITNTILNLKTNKREKASFQEGAIKFFSKVIVSQLSHLVCDSPKSFCIVPSHEQGQLSYGLMKVMSNISEEFDFSNTDNLLVRTATVEKSATGGDRSIQHHLDSLAAINHEFIEGKVIYLFDDISSTGNSMHACKEILLSAGALRVAMISFGQTWAG